MNKYSYFIATLKALDNQREIDIAWAQWVKTGHFPPHPRRRRALWFWAN